MCSRIAPTRRPVDVDRDRSACDCAPMRLCENALYIKLTTRADLLDEGGHLALIEDVESLAGERFATFRDLSATRSPIAPLEGRRDEFLGIHVGAGFHQTARFRVDAAGDGVLRTFELNAGLHPYSGVYIVQVDVRVDAAFAAARPEAVAALFTSWVHKTTPLTAQAHDVDDDAIQNIDSPRLAQLGYGRSAPAEAELRPGREAVRGQFRFAPTWLSFVGSDALELLSPWLERDALPPSTEHAGGLMFRLADAPPTDEDSEFRARQTALRAALGVDSLIERDRRSFAYWKRKS